MIVPLGTSSKVNSGGQQQPPAKASQGSQSSGLGKDIGGILGGTLGQIGGSVFGPGGTIAGGAGGGAVGGGLGESIDELIHGQGLNFGKIVGAGGEQGAYGAIPVGEEARAIPLLGKLTGGLVGREAVRGVTGAVGAGLGKISSNLGNGAPLTQGVGNSALVGGGANMLAPGIGKILKVPTSILENTGKNVATAIADKATMIGDVAAKRLQKIFGPEVVDTGVNGAFLDPEYKKLMDQYGLDNPSIKTIGENLKQGAIDTETNLQGLLSHPDANLPVETVMPKLNQIIKNSVGSQGFQGQTRDDFKAFIDDELTRLHGEEQLTPTLLGQETSGGLQRSTAMTGDSANLKKTGPMFTNLHAPASTPTNAGSSWKDAPIPMTSLLKLERAVGDKANWKADGVDPYKDLYFGIRNMINEQTQHIAGKTGNMEFNNLMDQHQKLIQMQARYKSLYQPGTVTLPEEVSNITQAKKGVMSKILSNPDAQAAAIASGSLLGGNYLPEPLKTPVQGFGLLMALNRESPRLAQSENIANKTMGIGKIAGKVNKSTIIEKLLQEMGVNLPNLGGAGK